MSNSIARRAPVFQLSRWRTVKRSLVQRPYDALAAELQASLTREGVLRKEKRDLSQRHVMLAQEFEHRITNGLQVIADLLSLQSRTTPTPEEARAQLSIAARRVVALGTVNHRLHLSNQPVNVEFIEFLVDLCDDLSGLLFQDQTDQAIVVQGTKVEIPSSLAHTLGLITNELITNSVKHANGGITVRVENSASATYSLSVLDDGPGLPAGVVTAKGTGLGLKVVLWLVKQIGGDLKIIPRANGSRACVTVTFCSPQLGTDDT
jgi:two-component sensor histidine kinase